MPRSINGQQWPRNPEFASGDITLSCSTFSSGLNIFDQQISSLSGKMVTMRVMYQPTTDIQTGLFLGSNNSNGYIAFYAGNLFRVRKIVNASFTNIGTTNTSAESNTDPHYLEARFAIGPQTWISAEMDSKSGQAQTITVADSSINLSTGTLIMAVWCTSALTNFRAPSYKVTG